jgi:hypothetical protein
LAIQHEGRAAGTRRPPNNYFLSTGRAEITTISTAPATNKHNLSPRCCDHCQRHAPRLARYVERLDGGCSDACRACFLRLTAAEAHGRLIAQFHGLFRHLRPWVFGLRGALAALAERIVNYLLARAMVGTHRGHSYRLWVAAARFVARVAEKVRVA